MFLNKYRQFLVASNLQDVSIQNHFKSIRVLLAYKGMPAHFVIMPKVAKSTKYDLTWPEVELLYSTNYKTKR